MKIIGKFEGGIGMKKGLSFIVMLLALMLVMVGCSNNDTNNGYSEGIIDMKTAIDEKEKEEFILYIYSSTCSHCAKMKPELNKYAEKTEGALPVYAYDLDDTTTHEHVRYFIDNMGVVADGTPTIVYVAEEKIYLNHVGTMAIEDLPVKGDYKNLTIDESIEK